MLLPNQCSFCAHQRIHTHKSPYCCPECGALCRSAYFQTHVKENCLHYARKVGYRWVLPGLLSCPGVAQQLVLVLGQDLLQTELWSSESWPPASQGKPFHWYVDSFIFCTTKRTRGSMSS